MRKILQKIILVLLIIILLYVLYSKYIKKDKVIFLFNRGFLVVITGSMEPEIKTGELVVIKKQDKYSAGDIITYDNGNSLITHRISEIHENAFIAKGDANNELDAELNNTRILGKVVYHSLFLGKFIVIYLKYIVIGFTVIVLIKNVYWNYKENKKEEEDISVDSEEKK